MARSLAGPSWNPERRLDLPPETSVVCGAPQRRPFEIACGAGRDVEGGRNLASGPMLRRRGCADPLGGLRMQIARDCDREAPDAFEKAAWQRDLLRMHRELKGRGGESGHRLRRKLREIGENKERFRHPKFRELEAGAANSVLKSHRLIALGGQAYKRVRLEPA